MALTVDTPFSSRPLYYPREEHHRETRPFSFFNRSKNPRAPRKIIRNQPSIDSDIYFSTPNVASLTVEKPPPRPPRSPKFERIIPHKPPRTPPRSPLAGCPRLSHTQSETDLHTHSGLRVSQITPPPRTPPGRANGTRQIFFPSDNNPPPRSPRIPPRSYHAPETPAVPPRSPRLPPKPMKLSQFQSPQPLTGRSNRTDKSDRCQSADPRIDFPKMTRQTSADTVRLTVHSEREVVRPAPPPPVVTVQPTIAHRIPDEVEEDRLSKGSSGQRSKQRTGDRETLEIDKPEEKKSCCDQCTNICFNDVPEFFIELCLDWRDSLSVFTNGWATGKSLSQSEAAYTTPKQLWWLPATSRKCCPATSFFDVPICYGIRTSYNVM